MTQEWPATQAGVGVVIGRSRSIHLAGNAMTSEVLIEPRNRFKAALQPAQWSLREISGLAGTLGCDRRCMELQPESANNSQNSRELWVPSWRKSFVQALPSKTGLSRELRHTFGASNVSKRRCEKRGITFFKCRLKIGRHVFFGLKMFRGIPDTSGCLGHRLTPYAYAPVPLPFECRALGSTWRHQRAATRTGFRVERSTPCSLARSRSSVQRRLHQPAQQCRRSQAIGAGFGCLRAHVQCDPSETRTTSRTRLFGVFRSRPHCIT